MAAFNSGECGGGNGSKSGRPVSLTIPLRRRQIAVIVDRLGTLSKTTRSWVHLYLIMVWKHGLSLLQSRLTAFNSLVQ